MSLRRLVSAGVFAACLAGAATPARADVADTLLAIGYVGSLIGGGIATAVNGSHLAFGEPAPRGWRIFGFAAAGVDFVWSGVMVAVIDDRSEGIALGAIAAGVGVGALLTALFVDEDDERPGIRATVIPGPSGATFGITGRF